MCLFGEGQSARMCASAEAPERPPVVVTSFKTNLSYSLCYVFSSRKRREVQTPVFVVFHRPDEPSFTFLPSA